MTICEWLLRHGERERTAIRLAANYHMVNKISLRFVGVFVREGLRRAQSDDMDLDALLSQLLKGVASAA